MKAHLKKIVGPASGRRHPAFVSFPLVEIHCGRWRSGRPPRRFSRGVLRKLVILAAALSAISEAPLRADTIAAWTFETAASTNHIIGAGLTSGTTQSGVLADIGTGVADASHASSAAWSLPAGNGSGHAWSVNTWAAGDYFEFSVSTLGFQNIVLSYDQTSSGTGPRDFLLQYSSDGVSFLPFGSTYLVLTNAASSNNQGSGLSTQPWSPNGSPQAEFNRVFDLSSLTALNDVPSVSFRLVAADNFNGSGGAISSGGTDRVDNFVVNATPVPEPATPLLAVLGGAAGFCIRGRCPSRFAA
jgi:hypothetical protein